ncbi:uncharacterized protein LOC133187278 [Saccostrea echinata]|uniref:uncharacterized protein LOC133187278 n=1 Tax=Saccostrea echinata TaxID=191078 RepID=UPI002A83AE64|nr:uncharacterized protein LOC133187278 [Saccostrea echinata]
MTELYVHDLMNGLYDDNETSEARSLNKRKQPIQDYFFTSVLVACLCFYMPTGLLAVNYAKKARSSLREGHEEEAERFSRKSLVLILTTILTLPVLLITAMVT